MKYVVLVFFFMSWLLPPDCQCQATELDSLVALLPAANEDTAKVDLLNVIAQKCRVKDTEQAIHYAEDAMNLAQKIDYEKGKAKAAYSLGAAHFYAGDTEKSKSFGHMGLEAARGAGLKELELANLVLLGLIYKNQGELDSTVQLMFSSIRLSEEIGDSSGTGAIYVNLGNLMLQKKDIAAAKKYYFQAKEILEVKGKKTHLTSLYLSIIHALDSPSEKLDYLNKAIVLAKEGNDIYNLAYAYKTQGHIYATEEENYEKAIRSFQRALEIERQIKNPRNLLNINTLLGHSYLKNGQPDRAISILENALAAVEKEGFTDYKAEVIAYLAEAYEQKKDYRLALQYQKESGVLKDSIFSKDWSAQLNDAKVKYETEKKEAEIVRQQLELAGQQNRQNQLLIGGLALLALTVAGFQYFALRQKQKKREVEMALEAEHAEAERLRQIDELKTTFFTNMSHELRTPLTLIISPLEEALKKLKQAPLEADLKLAHQNSLQLLGLVNEVMDLSKLEMGKMGVEKTEVEILPMLRRGFFSFQSMADLKKIRLDFHSDLAAGQMLETDVAKLEKILNNLISNALKFTPKGGRVEMDAKALATSQKLPTLELTVTDNGHGIHPDDLPHVFDRFFQSKKNGENTGGTGIGLALSKQLATLLGGDLTVESKFGKGSSFTLTIPVQITENQNINSDLLHDNFSQTTAAPDTTAVYEPIFINGEKPQILIVEDNVEMAEYLRKNLSKNYDCTVAEDGEAALLHLIDCQPSAATPHPLPDLISSDVMMPNMDGFALRAKLNERPEWRHIPFVMLTARTLEADKLEGFRLGIDDYVTKPFSLPELEARIHNLLKNKQLREGMEATKKEPELLSPGEEVLRSAEKLVVENMEDAEFTVEKMAKQLGFSQRQLARILGRTAGLTPVKFILEMRLHHARRLLESGGFATVAEVQYQVGIESASYFSRKFTERFGKNPSAFLGDF